ncbi:MAG: hypothetical protein KH086_00520 [Coprobacillus sp.]|nr:hypothetical protein [Coprobacillus sp.]DAN25182.1 MAG TPA: hypothetical protein [Caudoviricetes sp.]
MRNMKTWCVDFKNDNFGITIDAKTEEQAWEKAIKIANDPCHWKDRRKRVVDTVFQCN